MLIGCEPQQLHADGTVFVCWNAVWKCFCFTIGCPKQRTRLLPKAGTGLCSHNFIRNINFPTLQCSSFRKVYCVRERPSKPIIWVQLSTLFYPGSVIISVMKTPHSLQHHLKHRTIFDKMYLRAAGLAQQGLLWAQRGTQGQVQGLCPSLLHQ